jgi:hypothetical protein
MESLHSDTSHISYVYGHNSSCNKYSRFSYNAIVAFLENTALWKNRVIETIGSIRIKELGVDSSDSPSRMQFFYSN